MALEGGEKEWNTEDHDNDALNDETFGGDGGEFNWEEAQSALHAFEKQKTKHSNGKSQPQVPQGSRVISLQELEQSFDRELFKEDDFDNENMLEESISRLVMDEFDNEEEAKSKLRRLGGTNRSSLNTYFMPDQVAIKHHWFEKELPGGSSLFGPSVWSMHPTNTVGDVPPNHRMPNVPNAAHLQSHRINEPQVQAGIDNVLGKLADPRLMDRVPSKHVAPKSNSSLPSHKPVFKTVEEIERELLEGSDISNDSKVNQVTKKVDGNNQRPKVITAEELERELVLVPGSARPGPLRPPPGMAGMSPQMLQRMPPPHMMPNSPAFAQRMMANPQLHPQAAAQLAFHQQQQHMRMMQMNHLRGRMLEIEKLYECLLKIQEADIRKTLLMNADESTLVQRHENERKVKEVLEPQHKLSEILSVHKGKMLVSRLIPLMDNTFKFYLFAHMVGKFPEWGLTNEIKRTYLCVKHLDHQEFEYEIQLENISPTNQQAFVRIFMAPRYNTGLRTQFKFEEQFRLMITMDAFTTTLTPGVQTLKRSSLKSSVTVDWPKSQEELQKEVDSHTIFANTSTCGWPHHLLLPKGTEEGMVYDLVVMITPAEGIDIFEYRGWTQCGLKNKEYPDKKPMGYPWDRRPNPDMAINYLQDFVSQVPNMITTQIVITHTDLLGE